MLINRWCLLVTIDVFKHRIPDVHLSSQEAELANHRDEGTCKNINKIMIQDKK